jgi:hypothetical protein
MRFIGPAMAGVAARLFRQLTSRAVSVLSPTASAWLVIGFVVWCLARPFLHLGTVAAVVVDTVTALAVLLAAILIEASRQPPPRGEGVCPGASGGPPGDAVTPGPCALSSG